MAKAAKKKEPEQVTEQLIDDWQEAKNLRKQWEEKELQLRVKICDLLTPDVHSGTHRFEKFGFEIKIERKTNINIAKDDYEDVKDAFTEQEKACIRLKPEVNVKEYKKLLTEAERHLEEGHPEEVDIDRLLTCIKETPATPVLTIE